MGKSPGKWIKTVLFGKKSSKSSYPKGREKVANENQALVVARAAETNLAVAPPFSSQLNLNATERDERKLELENKEAANILHDDGTSLPTSQGVDSPKSTLQDSPYDPERIKQEQAATMAQAAFRGYLARRAFRALKGIIRLQALIRGHLVRRQAISALCCMMGIVKLQAHVRGLMVRHSDGGLELRKKCNQMNLLESKLVVSLGVNMPARIGKLSTNAFVCKLLASSPTVVPLCLHYDVGDPNSVWIWLERWSASCFWKPVPQPKKASDSKLQRKQVNGQAVEIDTGRPKRSVRRIPPAYMDGTSVQATSEFERPFRSQRTKIEIMPPKIEKEHLEVEVVDIASSDDEGSGQTVATKKVSSITAQPQQVQISGPEMPQSLGAITPPVLPSNETLESRSFWKAGNFSVGPTSRPALLRGSLEHARVHPKFLHSNATSHKWAFGAIAELMDNAVDEIHHGATFIKVDKIDVMKDNSPCPALLFLDDGGGMDPQLIRKCMSLGYSSKKSNTTIGQYGNGFKTSTMRLGADVIVFSRSTSAGTGQDDVIVPMIDFDISGHWAEPMTYSSQDDWSSNLKTILEWSPFSSKEELMLQFDDIGPHGTKIVIYNLWLNDEGIYELAFDDDDEDIRLRDEALTKVQKKTVEIQSHISYCIRYSLRAYASMLYLRKFNNFQIILRGKPVQQFNIADELKYPMVVTYKPQVAAGPKECSVATTIGFTKEAPSLAISGFNVYHKNRLIRPFWKVTSDGSIKGKGVVGVLEADFIEPAHDKQDFERSSLFVRLEAKLKQIVNEYWKTHCHLVGYQPPGFAAKMKKQLAAYHHNSSSNSRADGNDQSIPADDEQDLRDEQPGLEVPNEIMSEDDLASISVDQLCEENIQLFMRCEEQTQKEAELKQTIEELEKELEDKRMKCAQLSSYIEAKRKLKPSYT